MDWDAEDGLGGSDGEDDVQLQGANEQGEAESWELLQTCAVRDIGKTLDALGIDLRQERGRKPPKRKDPPFTVSFSDRGDPKSVDVRGRRLEIDWKPGANYQRARDQMIRRNAKVYDIVFRCKGGYKDICDRPCDYRVRVRVFASDLARASIHTQNSHDAPEDGARDPMPRLKALAFDYFAHGDNNKVSGFILHQTNVPGVDQQRLLSKGTVRSIWRRVRRSRYGSMSYDTLKKMAENDPGNVFCLDLGTKPGSQFLFAITDPIGLASAVVHGHDGICGLDSSWRNKNTQGMPLTYFGTVNPTTLQGKPVALMFSRSIKKKQLAKFLRWIAKRVQEFCIDLTEKDTASWPADLRKLEGRVKVIAEHGFRPSCMTIDKSRAEYNAIRSVFKHTQIRLCWFHIKQAIKRWTGDVSDSTAGGVAGNVEKSGSDSAEDQPVETTVPKAVRNLLLKPFQLVCRTSTTGEFDTLREAFYETDIPAAVAKGASNRNQAVKDAIVKAVRLYFERNWFTDVWSPCFLDHKCPEAISLVLTNTV
jgi:hypothetical protein